MQKQLFTNDERPRKRSEVSKSVSTNGCLVGYSYASIVRVMLDAKLRQHPSNTKTGLNIIS